MTYARGRYKGLTGRNKVEVSCRLRAGGKRGKRGDPSSSFEKKNKKGREGVFLLTGKKWLGWVPFTEARYENCWEKRVGSLIRKFLGGLPSSEGGEAGIKQPEKFSTQKWEGLGPCGGGPGGPRREC